MKKYAEAILAIVQESNNHLTAEQIFFRLKEMMPEVVLATVYNNLNRMYEKGLVRKVSVEGYPDRYDKIKRHDHLVCAKCGALSDIVFDDLTEILRTQTKEDIISYDLKVRYICPKCRARLSGNSFRSSAAPASP